MSLVLYALGQYHPAIDVAINSETLVKYEAGYTTAGWIVYYETFNGVLPRHPQHHKHRVAFVTTGGHVSWSNEIPQD